MLSQFLVTELFAFLLVFCRMGSTMMLLPGIGEAYVSPRFRILMAVLISMLITPMVKDVPIPVTVPQLLVVMLGEILVGLFLGAMSRILISAAHTAGTIIAFQISLASAVTPDIGQTQGQTTIIANLLAMVSIVIIFASDMHHLMLRGVIDSYTLFLPGQLPTLGDVADKAAHVVSGAFMAAMQMSSPFIVIGLLLNLGSGIIARLMPNIQIFFIMMAPQIFIGLFVLSVTISTLVMWYMEYFQNALGSFLSPS